MPVDMMVNGQYCCTLLQDKVRPAIHCKQSELLDHGVICSRTMQHLIKITMCKSVQCWGREVLAHPPYFPDPAPSDDWLFAHVTEHLWEEQCESEDDINIAVTASLHRLSKNEYRAAIDHIPHRWEKHVDNVGDYIEERTCV